MSSTKQRPMTCGPSSVRQNVAAMEGLPDAVRACQIPTDGVSPAFVRNTLYVCLAYIQSGQAKSVSTCGPLTVKQAAAYLNVSPKTIYAACESKALRHLRIGEGRGTIRINKADLEDFKRQGQSVVAKDYLS
ncbi:DNA-binding protein [Bremerella cremea]|uniref:DNA-binding protein n=1 Tax=Bremerella cremea TaxID=1031537 RepID=A0A368KM49_9BACT|nr:DNA-binding protein [Bremerella cremea]